MADHHFRLAENPVSTLDFSTILSLLSSDLNPKFQIIHPSDFTTFSPHILALWTTMQQLDGLPSDPPCKLARIVDIVATQATLPSMSHRYRDDDFNLPKGFLRTHPTIRSVLATDTKLLPLVPVYRVHTWSNFCRPLHGLRPRGIFNNKPRTWLIYISRL